MNARKNYREIAGALSVLTVIICVVIGCLYGFNGFYFILIAIGSFLSSILCALGEIVDKLYEIAENTKYLLPDTEKKHPEPHGKQITKSHFPVKEEPQEKQIAEDDMAEYIKNKQSQSLEELLNELRETSTADLELILQSQKDLYSESEYDLIKKEFLSRND